MFGQEIRELERSLKKKKYDVGFYGYVGIYLIIKLGDNFLCREYSMSYNLECNRIWQCGKS